MKNADLMESETWKGALDKGWFSLEKWLSNLFGPLKSPSQFFLTNSHCLLC